MEPAAQSTLDLLRRAKNPNEVDRAHQHVLRCVNAALPAGKVPSTTSIMSAEERQKLLAVSILVGALCRRVEQLFRLQTLNTAYEAEPNEDASLRFKRDVEMWMGHLWEALEPLRRRLQSSSTAPVLPSAPPTPPIAAAASSARGSGLLTAPVTCSVPELWADTSLYGIGELCDYYARRRAEVHQSLLTTLRQPRWEPKVVVEKLLWLQRIEERTTVGPARRPRAVAPPQGVVTAVTMSASLRDPLSRLPLHLPARGPHCTHVAVFDLTSLVQVAQQQQHQPSPPSPRHGAGGLAGAAGGHTPRAPTHASSVDMTCPICRTVFELPEVRVDVEARTALQAFYQTHPLDTVDVDHFTLNWDVERHTVEVTPRAERSGAGEKRSIASVDEDADVGDSSVQKVPRVE